MTGKFFLVMCSKRLRQMAALSIAVLLVCSVDLSAKKENKGINVTVLKTDDTLIEGELLSVKHRTLLIKNNDTSTGELIEAGQIHIIQIPNKTYKHSKDAKVAIGAISGAILGAIVLKALCNISDSANPPDSITFKFIGIGAAIGGLSGLAIGKSSHKKKNISMENRTNEDINSLFNELNTQARYPQDPIPQEPPVQE